MTNRHKGTPLQIYVDEGTKAKLEQLTTETGWSKAEVIRKAIELVEVEDLLEEEGHDTEPTQPEVAPPSVMTQRVQPRRGQFKLDPTRNVIEGTQPTWRAECPFKP